MTLDDLRLIFNRAFEKTLSWKKLGLMFTVLALCGLLVVFFKGIRMNVGQWVAMSFTFLPFFLCAGLLLSAGVLLVRIYHDEVKSKEVKYRDIVGKSWEIVLGASYFSVPLILCYLMLWIMLGIFVLFEEIPFFGDFFSVILAFAPFIINFCSVLLCLLNVAMLFFVTPALALQGLHGLTISQGLVERLRSDVFTNSLLLIVSILPLLAVFGILVLAGTMTGNLCYSCKSPVFTTLRWFFIMIPFVAVLSPTIVFFFNFAAESHVLMRRINH